MTLSLINEFFQFIVERVNSRYSLNIKLNQVITDINSNISKLPMNEKTINYQLFISSVQGDNSTSNVLSIVSVRVEFIFQVANKNYTKYESIFSRYIWSIFRELMDNEGANLVSDTDISYSLDISSINNVRINNADSLENNLYTPNISFDLWVTDNLTTN